VTTRSIKRMESYAPVLKALRYMVAWIQHGERARVLTLNGLRNEAIDLCILVVLSTLIPAFVEENAANTIAV
jgi:hypothetical protein